MPIVEEWPRLLVVRLLRILHDLNLSIRQLADEMGMDAAIVSRVANGQREPGPEFRLAVVKALRKYAPDLQERDVFVYGTPAPGRYKVAVERGMVGPRNRRRRPIGKGRWNE